MGLGVLGIDSFRIVWLTVVVTRVPQAEGVSNFMGYVGPCHIILVVAGIPALAAHEAAVREGAVGNADGVGYFEGQLPFRRAAVFSER